MKKKDNFEIEDKFIAMYKEQAEIGNRPFSQEEAQEVYRQVLNNPKKHLYADKDIIVCNHNTGFHLVEYDAGPYEVRSIYNRHHKTYTTHITYKPENPIHYKRYMYREMKNKDIQRALHAVGQKIQRQ